jgi:hypothetical protein
MHACTQIDVSAMSSITLSSEPQQHHPTRHPELPTRDNEQEADAKGLQEHPVEQ